MFRLAAVRLTHRLADAIDDMLLGDYAYVTHGGELYADVDYERRELDPSRAAWRFAYSWPLR